MSLNISHLQNAQEIRCIISWKNLCIYIKYVNVLAVCGFVCARVDVYVWKCDALRAIILHFDFQITKKCYCGRNFDKLTPLLCFVYLHTRQGCLEEL